jgi:hypothetical protein
MSQKKLDSPKETTTPKGKSLNVRPSKRQRHTKSFDGNERESARKKQSKQYEGIRSYFWLIEM